jgi:glyoxylase-like metal-dependent hydrolase (beta-lactamase superfamily II)
MEVPMKNLVNISLAMMAVSVSGCAQSPVKASEYKGRVIEYKSGPEGFDTRTFFYEGQNEVVAFDAQFTPELARLSIAHLRSFTKKPISWLVITHPNPDKFNGASVFKEEGSKIISSKHTADAIPGVHAYKEYYFVEMAKMFKRGEYPQPTSIDQTFEGTMDLVLRGGERIKLQELSQPGVSHTQTVAFVKSVGALFVGDLIHNKAHAWLEGGIVNGKPTPTIEGWISDLKELESIYPAQAIVFGGRGFQADLKTSVNSQIRYLKIAVQLINDDLNNLGSKAQDFNGPNAGALYKELSVKFQQKFPDYDLAYMVEYGAYGLVQSEMKNRK